MMRLNSQTSRILVALPVMMAPLFLVGCSSPSSPPQQVESQNPSVTYKYRGDDELLAANQKAVTFCNQYKSLPQTQDIRDSSNGEKTVTFDCVAAPATSTTVTTVPSTTLSAPSSNLTSTYRTDQELLNASRNAEIYCGNQGARQTTATIVTNTDGSRTVTFQCVS
ncbi:hypothetical protein ACFPL7_23790 [Dongia soli]|uniref:Secreted protein n=1 Tax=Dongia soli TaxID=600628 RepID=A0ABU5EFY7_9PROT|nr:hypothetical protein [Dongia soli]MDY0885325.1 hypothetical protein [Dongia soli]